MAHSGSSSSQPAATGECPICRTENDYARETCSFCGAYLPWAQAPDPATQVVVSSPPDFTASPPLGPAPALDTASLPLNTASPPGPTAPPGPAPAAGSPQKMYWTVQITGDIIEWPCVCCCCCAPIPHPLGVPQSGPQPLSLKMSVKAWHVLYCDQCLRHVQLAAEHDRASTETMSFTGCLALFLMLLVFVTLKNAAAFLGILCLLISVGVLWVTYRIERKLDAEQKLKNDALLQQARDLMKPQCCHTHASTWLESNQGSILRFAFYNEQFSLVFAAANAENVVYTHRPNATQQGGTDQT